MPTESGYSNQKKLGQSQFKTINNTGSSTFGSPIIQKTLFDISLAAQAIVSVTDVIGKDGLVEFWNIEITGHLASKYDVLRMISGPITAWEFEILNIIDANNFYILPSSDIKPTITDTAKTLRWTTSKSDAEGNLTVVVTPSPTSFVKDTVTTVVTEDTATPANNTPLPTQGFIYIDGIQYPVGKDTGTPANTVSVPVEITGASGPINITAGDLNVQLSDQGANADVTRIGDGTNQWGINASNEGLVHDADVLAQAVLLVAKDFATSAKQDALLTELRLKADLTETQPVSIASVPLPTGAATQVTLAALLTELQLKADLTETQPVSGPLTDAQLRASAVPVSGTFFQATQPISAASLPLPTGASTLAEQQAQSVLVGAVTETAPASDTASSGLNGRLQRIAQRIASLIALIPTSLGQKTMANSFTVTLASDQSALSTTQTAFTGSFQEILNLTNSVQTFTAPANAKWCKVYADDTNAANIRVKLGAAATITSGIQFQPGRSEDFQIAGNVSVICETANTNQKINVHFGV